MDHFVLIFLIELWCIYTSYGSQVRIMDHFYELWITLWDFYTALDYFCYCLLLSRAILRVLFFVYHFSVMLWEMIYGRYPVLKMELWHLKLGLLLAGIFWLKRWSYQALVILMIIPEFSKTFCCHGKVYQRFPI